MDLTGRILKDYRVLRRLGRGAMAEVYLAEQQSLSRQVALKVLNEELARDANYIERFQQEAKAVAALVHAGIVQIYEVGQADGYYFIAQEYVAGRNLGEVVEREGPLPTERAIDILRQAAAALDRAALRGIVHRDIKPENLMLAASGEVKIADFGLARITQPGSGQNATKLTQVGQTMGTPLYMSPEQIEGRPLDARSDLYSLGVTAYHLLVGEPPFRGETPMAVAVQHLNSDAPSVSASRLDLPVELSQLVDGLLAKDPAKRPGSPAEVLATLNALSNGSISHGVHVAEPRLEATTHLGELMKQATALRPKKLGITKPLLGAIAAVMVGGLLAMLLRPEPLLAGAREGTVEKPDVLRQLFHAKLVDTEDGWRAVARRFPNADPYYHYVAMENLARLYLRRGEPDAALRLCRQLADLGDSQRRFRLFGIAGQAVCELAMGNRQAAERALSQFPTDGVEELREADPLMAQMLGEARRELGGG